VLQLSVFRSCPECGSTNFEDGDRLRTFPCGFASDFHLRVRRCEAVESSSFTDSRVGDDAPALREALSDAATIIEGIAEDMNAAAQDDTFIAQLEDLAEQLQTVARTRPKPSRVPSSGARRKKRGWPLI